MSRRGRILAVIGFAAAVLAVGGSPFVLMLLPNPQPVLVADVREQLPGDYVTSGAKTYHLFPRAEQVESFPDDSAVVGPDAVFVVKYRQLANLEGYTLWSFDDGERVEIAHDLGTPNLLQLRPREPLPAGRYYAVVARESIYGGEDYVYFSVSEGGAPR